MVQQISAVTSDDLPRAAAGERLEEMIEDKATERWKERAKKLGLIVNMGADELKPKPKSGRSDGRAAAKEKPAEKARKK
jgi:hypothetical protein